MINFPGELLIKIFKLVGNDKLLLDIRENTNSEFVVECVNTVIFEKLTLKTMDLNKIKEGTHVRCADNLILALYPCFNDISLDNFEINKIYNFKNYVKRLEVHLYDIYHHDSSDDIVQCQVMGILKFIGSLPGLTELYITFHQSRFMVNSYWSKIEEGVLNGKLTRLTKLNFKSCRGSIYQSAISPFIHVDLDKFHLPSLQELTFEGKFKVFSKNLKGLPQLEIVNMTDSTYCSENEDLDPMILFVYSSYHVHEQIRGFQQIESLKFLNLSGTNISKIFDLERFQQIQHLNLSRNRISEIENLGGLVNLETLDLNYNNIKMVEGLSSLQNLTKLSLTRNRITEIQNIRKLKRLSELILDYNYITTLDDYTVELPSHLEYLSISYNRISHIDIERKYPALKFLCLAGNNLQILPNLASFPVLNHLDASSNNIHVIEDLNSCCELEVLCLSDNRISKLGNLDNLIKLNNLDLKSNQIESLEFLTNLENLRHLSICGNNISEIVLTDGLNKLESLKIQFQDHGISNIVLKNSLNNLKNLENIPLSIDGLNLSLENSLNHLEILKVQNCNIERFSSSRSLKKAKHLDLSYNSITCIDYVQDFESLNSIKLNHNSLKKIPKFVNCPNLKYVNLSRNMIGRIENVQTINTLEKLYLFCNKITSSRDIIRLLQAKNVEIFADIMNDSRNEVLERFNDPETPRKKRKL
ncbi:hypothetical protein DASC09_046050 [Saccharomycopsis crataegensis]|uniref:L domain-like protein n=1 Tax=Saccharomycopsis crataegensis TaxID=43959 RepID=A0AAV5QSM8_9ASCO|nr:hypothetical protein DASC09_046050 [Saccharomycopsis crataegensis]